MTRDARAWVLSLAVPLSLILCYTSVFASLVRHWWSNDMYAHGFFIPLISGYLLWTRRHRLAEVRMAPLPVLGSVVMAAGLGMLIVGGLGAIQVVQDVSLLVTLTGLVLLIFGFEMLRAISFPLVYLLFMIPIWDFSSPSLHFFFQRLSAVIGASILDVASIPVRRDGVFVHLPNITLEVAQECSGVNFLVAIVAIGLPQAYLALSGMGHRVLALVIGMGVALLSNGVRVALIGFLAYYGMTGADIHGPGHALQGMSIAAVGFLALFAAVHALARREPKREERPVAVKPSATHSFRVATAPTALASSLLLATAAIVVFYHPQPVEARPMPKSPGDLAGWRAISDVPAPSFFENAGVDDAISVSYRGRSTQPVELYVGYFAHQSQAKELANYRMSALHRVLTPAQLQLGDGATIEVNEGTYEAEGVTRYVLFWYDINGRSVADRYAAKGWTIWNALARSRSDGAVIMVTTDAGPGDDPARAAADVRSVAVQVASRLSNWLPR